jgi:hypothetical protein
MVLAKVPARGLLVLDYEAVQRMRAQIAMVIGDDSEANSITLEGEVG